MADDQSYSRRSILGLTGGLVGVAALGGAGVAYTDTTTANVSDGSAPSVEWTQTYEGNQEEYQLEPLQTVFQPEDGGYALPGSGAPIERTGAEETQFALVRTDASGEQQWVAFADPPEGRGDLTSPRQEQFRALDGVQTTDGGFVVVGYSEIVQQSRERRTKNLAHAAKFSSTGEVEWTRTIDARREGHDSDDPYWFRARFWGVVPTADGGVIAAGEYGYPFEDRDQASTDEWLVKFTDGGETAWERYFDRGRFTSIEPYGDGYVATYGNEALITDTEGREQRRVELDITIEEFDRPRTIPTADGGFALTAQRRAGERDFLLARFDEDGIQQWMKEYDGPASDNDESFDLTQTGDGGFALAGYMSEASSTEEKSAILRTDSAGAEEWEKLLEENNGRLSRIIQTADGGFAALAGHLLVKLSEEGDSDTGGTATETDTATRTEEPTETDETTATDTATATETDSEDSTDTDEDTPAATTTDTDTSGEGADDEDDCVI